MQIKIAELGRQFYDLDFFDELFARAAEVDQIFNRANFQFVFFGEFFQFRQSRHRAVVVQNLAEHADGPATGESGQIHGGLGVAGALQNSARPGAERKNVAGLYQIFRHGDRFGHDLNRLGAVGGGNSAS